MEAEDDGNSNDVGNGKAVPKIKDDAIIATYGTHQE